MFCTSSRFVSIYILLCKYCMSTVGILYFIPGHHGVPASQSGRVQLKDGGDVHAIRNRDQSVHDFLLWSSQTTS